MGNNKIAATWNRFAANASPRQVALIVAVSVVVTGLLLWLMFHPRQGGDETAAPPAPSPAPTTQQPVGESAPEASTTSTVQVSPPVAALDASKSWLQQPILTNDPRRFAEALAVAACTWNTGVDSHDQIEDNIRSWVDPTGEFGLRVGAREFDPLTLVGDHWPQSDVDRLVARFWSNAAMFTSHISDDQCASPETDVDWWPLHQAGMTQRVIKVTSKLDQQHATWGLVAPLKDAEQRREQPGGWHVVTVTMTVWQQPAQDLHEPARTVEGTEGIRPEGQRVESVTMYVNCSPLESGGASSCWTSGKHEFDPVE